MPELGGTLLDNGAESRTLGASVTAAGDIALASVGTGGSITVTDEYVAEGTPDGLMSARAYKVYGGTTGSDYSLLQVSGSNPPAGVDNAECRFWAAIGVTLGTYDLFDHNGCFDINIASGAVRIHTAHSSGASPYNSVAYHDLNYTLTAGVMYQFRIVFKASGGTYSEMKLGVRTSIRDSWTYLRKTGASTDWMPTQNLARSGQYSVKAQSIGPYALYIDEVQWANAAITDLAPQVGETGGTTLDSGSESRSNGTSVPSNSGDFATNGGNQTGSTLTFSNAYPGYKTDGTQSSMGIKYTGANPGTGWSYYAPMFNKPVQQTGVTGAELRWWFTIEKDTSTGGWGTSFSDYGGHLVNLKVSGGKIYTYCNWAGASPYNSAGSYVEIGQIRTGRTYQLRVKADYTAKTIQVSIRQFPWQGWTRLKNASAGTYDIPMQTSGAYLLGQLEVFSYSGDGQIIHHVDEVQYANTAAGIIDGAPQITFTSSAGAASGSLSLTAPTVTPATLSLSASNATASGSLTVRVTPVILGTSNATASGSLDLTTTSATGSRAAPGWLGMFITDSSAATIPLIAGGSSATATGSLSLQAPSAKLISGTSTATASGALNLRSTAAIETRIATPTSLGSTQFSNSTLGSVQFGNSTVEPAADHPVS